MEDDDQDTNQDQGQEEDQIQNEETKCEEENMENQDLSIERRIAKDHPIHSVIGDISKGVITRHPLSKVCNHIYFFTN